MIVKISFSMNSDIIYSGLVSGDIEEAAKGFVIQSDIASLIRSSKDAANFVDLVIVINLILIIPLIMMSVIDKIFNETES